MLICVVTCGQCVSPHRVYSSITSSMLWSARKCARIWVYSNWPTNLRVSIVEVAHHSVIMSLKQKNSRAVFRGALTFQKGQFEWETTQNFVQKKIIVNFILVFQRSGIVLFDRIESTILSTIFEWIRHPTVLQFNSNVHIKFWFCIDSVKL